LGNDEASVELFGKDTVVFIAGMENDQCICCSFVLYILLFLFLLSFLHYILETVIPICPPACGQNLFSVSAAVSLGGLDVLLLVFACMCRQLFSRLFWYI
jgi:hypothetical protein